MTRREILLKLLDEYNTALENLCREAQEIEKSEATPVGTSRRAIANQLAYLEYRILQLETQLNVLDLSVHHPMANDWSPEAKSGLLAQLNPWHADFRIWVYVAVLAVMFFSVVICNIISTWSLR